MTAALLSVVGMYALYLTPLYAVSLESDPVHHAVHAHFLLSGYLFAWAIAGPDPMPRRPSIRVRLVVLIPAGSVHASLERYGGDSRVTIR